MEKTVTSKKYLVYNGVTIFLTVISNGTSILVADYSTNRAEVKETVTVVK